MEKERETLKSKQEMPFLGGKQCFSIENNHYFYRLKNKLGPDNNFQKTLPGPDNNFPKPQIWTR